MPSGIAMSLRLSGWAALAVVFVARPTFAETPLRLVLDGLEARSIGPANSGGRIVDLAVVESNPKVYYVAAASGGV